MVMPYCGKLSLNSRSTAGRIYWQAAALLPIRSLPLPHLPNCCKDSRVAAISIKIFSAWCSSCSPACVSNIFLPILSKRRHPASCSSAFIEWLIADWVRVQFLGRQGKTPRSRQRRQMPAIVCCQAAGSYMNTNHLN